MTFLIVIFRATAEIVLYEYDIHAGGNQRVVSRVPVNLLLSQDQQLSGWFLVDPDEAIKVVADIVFF